jgi:hypothetical protein
MHTIIKCIRYGVWRRTKFLQFYLNVTQAYAHKVSFKIRTIFKFLPHFRSEIKLLMRKYLRHWYNVIYKRETPASSISDTAEPSIFWETESARQWDVHCSKHTLCGTCLDDQWKMTNYWCLQGRCSLCTSGIINVHPEFPNEILLNVMK